MEGQVAVGAVGGTPQLPPLREPRIQAEVEVGLVVTSLVALAAEA